MIKSKTLPLWVYPVAYLLHATEEFFGGAGLFSRAGLSLAPNNMRGFHLTPVQFILLNCGAAVALLFALQIARRRGFPHLLLIVLSTLFLVNGSLHILTTLRTGAYTPGLITSPLALIPVGAYTLYRLRRDMSPVRYGCGIALGAVGHLCISLVAHNGRALFG